MGRHKTISDDEVLAIARDIFRRQGHTATTRTIADAAGVSEAILYQRFGSKDALFFASMHPSGPDIEEILGPKDPPEDAHAYLRTVVVRIGRYFGEVIPLALRVMTHPSFEPGSLGRAQPRGGSILQAGLAERLTALVSRKRLATASVAVSARLLVSLAHDWALSGVFAGGNTPHRERELKEMVDVLWEGICG
jgi:AcrR family transcriptional regulator